MSSYTSTRTSTLVVTSALVAIAAMPLLGSPPHVVIVTSGATVLAAAVFASPPRAAYLLVTLTPLTAGLNRGLGVPLLRPYEALAALLGAIVAARRLTDRVRGMPRRLGAVRLEGAILALAVTSSALPALWALARGQALTRDDLLYCLTVWKYAAVYAIVRASVRTSREVAVCLELAVTTGCVVAVIAALQALQLFHVPALLAQYYPDPELHNTAFGYRGSATLGSSIAVGDVTFMSLGIAVALLVRGFGNRRLLGAAYPVLLIGCLASGQFSALIGLVVTLVALACLSDAMRRITLAGLPTLASTPLLLYPVFGARLGGFSSSGGIPPSWRGRLTNLRVYFWPKLAEGWNPVFGVRPAARIRAFETWRSYIYIESGHTYLLWVGGIPCLLAYFCFVAMALRTTWAAGHRRQDAIGAAAAAAVAAVAAQFILMALDPHLILRGAADLVFTLLALSVVRPHRQERALGGVHV